jgi:hypothetical protein
MPRKLKLTWIAKLKQWKKVYKGKQHWLGTGASKDDMQSYKLALEEFERRKVKIDAEARAADQTSPYAPWQNSLASREGVEPEKYLVSPKAVPDSPQSIRNRETIGVPTIMSSVPYGSAAITAKGDKKIAETITAYLADQKQRYLHGVKFPKSPQSQRIGGQRYIAYEYNAGLMTDCWKDEPLPKTEADLAKLMIQFRNECKTLLTTGKIKASTYNERVKTLRHFVGWLHDNYLIDAIPRKTSEICGKYKTESKDTSMARFYKDMSKVDVDKLFAPLDKATDELEKYYGLTLDEAAQRPAASTAA